jgi:stage III sporulation protein SpoIIIAA
MEYRITDDIDKLLEVLPHDIVDSIEDVGKKDELIEIVMDLGRVPTARYVDENVILSDREIESNDIEYVVSKLGMFDADNRAGMERTLHRISAIRNRQRAIVGLTCRVGRAVYGTIDIIEDIITQGSSVLLLGPPGVGKTTLLREAARVLSETRRVVIVDTSNEIGGDGDVPHPAIGLARRMQVSQPALQHEVMIEAVENHNPEVIIIDEIGRELEALAARTIAERGVQLVGTAHGNTLENLLRNPTLTDLVGGIESVTLSDEEARRRRTQKSVLERRSPPTFDVLIEIKSRNHLVILDDLASAVDAHLRGRPLPVEVRQRDEYGEIDKQTVYPESRMQINRGGSQRSGRPGSNGNGSHGGGSSRAAQKAKRKPESQASPKATTEPAKPRSAKIYAYGVARNRLYGAAADMNVPVELVDNMTEADVVVTLKSYYRRRPKLIVDAERRSIPIHVLRANTSAQVENFLSDLYEVQNLDDPVERALAEARAAIRLIQNGEAFEVDLEPQSAKVRRMQHQLIEEFNLSSQSYGDQPNRFVRVYGDDIA